MVKPCGLFFLLFRQQREGAREEGAVREETPQQALVLAQGQQLECYDGVHYYSKHSVPPLVPRLHSPQSSASFPFLCLACYHCLVFLLSCILHPPYARDPSSCLALTWQLHLRVETVVSNDSTIKLSINTSLRTTIASIIITLWSIHAAVTKPINNPIEIS